MYNAKSGQDGWIDMPVRKVRPVSFTVRRIAVIIGNRWCSGWSIIRKVAKISRKFIKRGQKTIRKLLKNHQEICRNAIRVLLRNSPEKNQENHQITAANGEWISARGAKALSEIEDNIHRR